MINNTNLESTEKIFRKYPSFYVGESRGAHVFSNMRDEFKGGVPLAYDPVERRIAVDPGDTHTLIWGSTGSLKTRCVIEPTIKILGKAGESMIINDPKAEIFTRCAAELKENGYRVKVINLRDPEYGNSWNPLAIPYSFWLSENYDLASALANDLADSLMLSEKSASEAFWDYSARDVFFGLVLLLFKYCSEHNSGPTMVNMSSVAALRRKLFERGTMASQDILWKYASENELIASNLSGSVYAPKETMHSILSVFDQKIGVFMVRPSLLDMLANNDIDIAMIPEEKTAVFLIVPDEKTTYNGLVSTFVKQSYEYLIHLATGNDGHRLHNRVNFVLDEFSALPPIDSMSSMISAARSRNVRFMLAVQGKHQLTQRYGNEAETIKSNCLNWIYLMSRELDLLREISDLCGEQRNHTPNVSVFDLQHLSKEKCEALIMCGRMKPALVNLLDIDRFGESRYTVLDFEKLPRKKRQPLNFPLAPDIVKRLTPKAATVEQKPMQQRAQSANSTVDMVNRATQRAQRLREINRDLKELETQERFERAASTAVMNHKQTKPRNEVLDALDSTIERLIKEEGYFEPNLNITVGQEG